MADGEPLDDAVMLCDALGVGVTDADAEHDGVADADVLVVALGVEDTDGDELALALCVHDGPCVCDGVSDCVSLEDSAWLGVPDTLAEAVADGVAVSLPVPEALSDAVGLRVGDKLCDGVVVPLAELDKLGELDPLVDPLWLGVKDDDSVDSTDGV